MSNVSENAAVRLILADYAAADAAGKLDIIGGGLTGLGQNRGTPGLTLPFALVVLIVVPPQFYNEQCSVEILLEDSAGSLAVLPAPAPGMTPQPMRIGQAITFEEQRFPAGVNAPRGFLPLRAQWVVAFNPGLPLLVGQGYKWRVRIDDETRDEWTERFVVFGPAPGPVLG